MNRIASLLALCLLSAPLPAQEGGKQESKKKDPGAATATEGELTVTTYTARVFGAEELLMAAAQLYGKDVMVATSDESGRSGFYTVPRFVQLGELLLVRDAPESARRIVATLNELEERELVRQKQSGKVSSADEVAFDRLELRPRYISMSTLERTLSAFRRRIPRRASDGSQSMIDNVTMAPEAGFVLVLDEPQRLKEIEQLVASVDRPQPQMTITAMLVDPDGGRELPAELASSLAEMLPGQTLSVASVAVLRCSTQSGNQCELKTELGGGMTWGLTFLADAFNADTNELSLSHCQFELRSAQAQGKPDSVQRFTTTLTIKAGEYVVLGAVGTEPTFVVLRAQPVRTAPVRGGGAGAR
jgi:hypothetical protein